MQITGNRVPFFWFSVLMVFAAHSRALPVMWTLDSFVFEDGGVVEGSLVVDAYTDFSEVRVGSSATSTYRGANYATTFSVFDPYVYNFPAMEAVAGGSSVLSIGWYPRAMGASAGIANVDFLEGACSGLATGPGGDGYCSSYSPSPAGIPGAHLVSVALDNVRVPEPDVVILMGLGLAGIAFARISRKQRHRKTTNPG